MPPRAGIRARLTARYAALFLACGAVLIAINFAVLSLVAFQPSVRTGSLPFTSAHGTVEQQARDRYRGLVMGTMLRESSLGLVAMTAVAGGLGWLAAARALRPVRRITAVARRASEHDLRERVALAGPRDELRDLADTFDGLLTRLDGAFEVQRRFATDASRELRAPLAGVREAVDRTLDAPIQRAEDYRRLALGVRGAIERADRLVDSLLVLARSEQEVRAREPLDLADAAADAAGAAGRRDVVLEARPALVFGARPLLERAVDGLVDNAVHHNRPGGLVEVATGVSDDGLAFVEVRNDGPLVAVADALRLAEPFHRLRGEGPGLGLTIAATVAARHGGSLAIQPRPEGGLVVRFVVPTRAPASG